MKTKLIKFFNLIKKDKQAKILTIIGIILLFIFTLGYSLSMFTTSQNNKVANIKVNDLSFNITTNSGTSDDRVLHLQANKIESFNVIITNLNKINTKYELIYDICTNLTCTNTTNSLPNGVKVEFMEDNSDELNGLINNTGETKKINLLTTNNTNNDVYIKLNLNAGYEWNELELANQIKEYKNETNIIAYVDGIETKKYPDKCNYKVEAKAYIGSQQVTLENLTVTCNKSTKKWTTNYTGYADRIEVKFTRIPPPIPTTFAEDSWSTIAAVVEENPSAYALGDTKQVTIEGKNYTVRVANNTTPTECNDSTFSQTACGFVVEFVSIIDNEIKNQTNTNVGGWPASAMRAYANGDFYNKLPAELRNIIIDTKVVSGHGSSDKNTNRTDGNWESIDKIYFLSSHEIWDIVEANVSLSDIDTAFNQTRRLDYYKSKCVTTRGCSEAIKRKDGYEIDWMLRAAYSKDSNSFLCVEYHGAFTYGEVRGIPLSPAFRIG